MSAIKTQELQPSSLRGKALFLKGLPNNRYTFLNGPITSKRGTMASGESRNSCPATFGALHTGHTAIGATTLLMKIGENEKLLKRPEGVDAPSLPSSLQFTSRDMGSAHAGDSCKRFLQELHSTLRDSLDFRKLCAEELQWHSAESAPYSALRRHLWERELFVPIEPGKPLAEMELTVGTRTEVDFTYLAPCIGIVLLSDSSPLVCGAHVAQILDDPARINAIAQQQTNQMSALYTFPVSRILLATASEGEGSSMQHYQALRGALTARFPSAQLQELTAGNLGVLPDHDDLWLGHPRFHMPKLERH